MARIDTGDWHVFTVGDLFSIRKAEGYRMTNAMLMDDGPTPVVVNSKMNNGVGGRTSQAPTEKGDVLTFSSTTTVDTIFYQPDCFVGRQHIQVMEPKGRYADMWNRDRLLFFGTVLRKTAEPYGFSYYNRFTAEKAASMRVLLPVDGNGNPDWEYMDSHMREAFDESGGSLPVLEHAGGDAGMPINDAAWGDFIIGDLFDKLHLGIRKHDFSKAEDVSKEITPEFSLPLVNAKRGNNGIMYYGRESDFDSARMTLDIIQSGNSSAGTVYAQPDKTGVLGDAYLIRPKHEIGSVPTLLFLAAILEKALAVGFDYSNKCTWDRVRSLSICLPIDRAGNPDWDFMDRRMRLMLESTERSLSALQTIIRSNA